ncbi:ARMT1-like domain-containing protein [Lyngbya sp. CCY1209]|uniref:damage-control phosphatase ARMT1 family protein n=1 Tax=Lyngbya sp. CCY1209 TaxID=2886103 RepID=UPI002D213549|nr:ARMT1-like domain-containing protein [Lyngbya sp. CCY1209]MEB3883062.1 ARMT1-like domain-containing protein [Lyngbya sp. CCY1209]
MRTYIDCISCFLKQAQSAVTIAVDDPSRREQVMGEVLEDVSRMNFDRSTVEIGAEIHRTLREASGNPDPYREIKDRSNRRMLALYPHFSQQIQSAEDPLEMAVRMAIAANIIDFGAIQNLDEETIDNVMSEASAIPLDRAAVEQLRREVERAETILYLGDNAGEIVCDRLLIEQLPREKITFVVRGNPVLNDVTMVDAEAVGMTKIVPVIDNGFDAPGTVLEFCSPEFRDRFQAADLIIAKGQGNYESLSDNQQNIFFLLKAKCPVIAKEFNSSVGVQILQKVRH